MKQCLIIILVGFAMSLLLYLIVLHKPKHHRHNTPTLFPASGRYFYYCKELRYRPAPYDYPVALLSYPGSGNTWLRHLLQESTGYLTGSFRKDEKLFQQNFPAESVRDGSVLVVKMHEMWKFLADRYRATVLLIRNPMDAILSEFNRFHKGPLGTVNASIFLKGQFDWPSMVKRKIAVWEDLYRECLTQLRVPVYIVFYERLLEDTKNTLRGVLNFLNETVSEEDLNCAVANGEGMFLRKKKLHFDPFTLKMHKYITQAEKRILWLAANYMQIHKQGRYMNSSHVNRTKPDKIN